MVARSTLSYSGPESRERLERDVLKIESLLERRIHDGNPAVQHALMVLSAVYATAAASAGSEILGSGLVGRYVQ